jgi:hypothetical protein
MAIFLKNPVIDALDLTPYTECGFRAAWLETGQIAVDDRRI